MKRIKEILFGKRADSLGIPKSGWTTTCHGPYTNFGDWCKEFRVSMLSDKKTLYIENPIQQQLNNTK